MKTTITQNVFRILLAIFMFSAGFSHLTYSRIDFHAQVPDWVPLSKDLVVILSGIVEMALGFGLAFWKRERALLGWVLALFFILIFPGNIAQYINATDAFGLDSDTARLTRLFFQPVLIAWALWSAGSWKAWKIKKMNK
ncbi:MAG: hypothetical protein PF517_05940 [Salinivirgaceae bacterium]|jgi:uncharacterized membrane protein|nr:hypothetical protein [Salinivirgaceae bacterium]